MLVDLVRAAGGDAAVLAVALALIAAFFPLRAMAVRGGWWNDFDEFED